MLRIVREASIADYEVVADLMHEHLQWAIDRLRQEYAVEWPPVDRASTLENVTTMRRPEAAVFLAEVSGSAVGVGAFRRLEPQVAEIKRMYVRPAA